MSGDLCLILPIEMCYLALYFGIYGYKECLSSRLGDLHTNATVRQGTRSVIRWHRPPEGWCKLNSDGVVAPSSRESVCGGVIRNAIGNSLIGFSRQLGISFGLRIRYEESETTLSLVSHIVSMINRQWNVEMNHIILEGNTLADCMAKFASRDDIICHRFLSPPGSIILQFEEDLHNISIEGG
ncbi:hypothetical protein GQ457_09G008770 [Hibiscus cannabinus]